MATTPARKSTEAQTDVILPHFLFLPCFAILILPFLFASNHVAAVGATASLSSSSSPGDVSQHHLGIDIGTSAGGTPCASHETCTECSLSSRFCHWCASDDACHAIGSVHGCAAGTNCYSNDRCTRAEPERRSRDGDIGALPAALISIVACAFLCCATASYLVAGAVRGAYDDLETAVVAGSSSSHIMMTAPPSLESGLWEEASDDELSGRDRKRFLELTGRFLGTRKDLASAPPRPHPALTDAFSEANDGVGAEGDGGGRDPSDDRNTSLHPQGGDEEEEVEEERRLVPYRGRLGSGGSGWEESRRRDLLVPSHRTALWPLLDERVGSDGWATMPPAAAAPPPKRSKHARNLFCMCRLCYAFTVAIIVALAILSFTYYPRAPIYNVCSDELAWKSIVDGMASLKMEASFQVLVSVYNPNQFDAVVDRGSGSFSHDGSRVGTFSIPGGTTVTSSSITDLLVTCTFTAEKWEALSLTSEYYRGTLAFDVSSTVTVSVPALGGYSSTVSLDEYEVRVNDPRLQDRELCACPDWKDVTPGQEPSSTPRWFAKDTALRG